MKKILEKKEIYQLITLFTKYNFPIYLVGGCVRDYLMGRNPDDYDFTTPALPTEIIRFCEKEGIKVISTGLKHGTVTIKMQNELFEVTTFRIDENSIDNRHAEVSFITNIEEDLARRDFTINAIAYDCIQNCFIDPFHGMDDIQSKILRCVGNPQERFEEDYLRIIRGFRFAVCYQLDVQEDTKIAMLDCVAQHKLNQLSKERIHAELIKIFSVELFDFNTGYFLTPLLFELFPDLKSQWDYNQNNPYHSLNLWEHTLHVIANTGKYLDSFNKEEKARIRLAALFHDIGKPSTQSVGEDGFYHYLEHDIVGVKLSEAILSEYKFSNEEKKYILNLIKLHQTNFNGESQKSVKKLMIKAGKNLIFPLLYLMMADNDAHIKNEKRIKTLKIAENTVQLILNQRDALSLKDLSINGNDVMQILNQSSGKEVGAILNKIFEVVLSGTVKNKKSEIIKYLKREGY
ncbi:MAG: HD domain-containing protein [Erysipelotrichaceae bacterium]